MKSKFSMILWPILITLATYSPMVNEELCRCKAKGQMEFGIPTCYAYNLTGQKFVDNKTWVGGYLSGYWLHDFLWFETYLCPDGQISRCFPCLYTQCLYNNANGQPIVVPNSFNYVSTLPVNCDSRNCDAWGTMWGQNYGNDLWNVQGTILTFDVEGCPWEPGGDGSCSVGNQAYYTLVTWLFPT
jgi:hypothetical protein